MIVNWQNTGGSTGVRDEALLDSALARPQQLHSYGEPPPDLADLAAGLADGTIGEAEFAQWLRTRIVSQTPGSVQESAPAYRR